MSDLANFDPAAVAALTPEARATFTASLAKAGFAQADIDARLRAQQPSSSPGPTQRPAGGGSLDWKKHPTLSDRQVEQAAETLKKHWTGDADVLRNALENAGYKEGDTNDTRTETERSFDASLGGAAPEEYDLNGIFLGRTGNDVEGLAEIDRDMRGMLSAMEIPPPIGRGLVEAILDANEHGWATRRSDPDRALYHQEQRAIALRATGAESWDDLLGTAKQAVARIPKATFTALAEAGVFEDARVLALLYGQGERLTLRQGLKARR